MPRPMATQDSICQPIICVNPICVGVRQRTPVGIDLQSDLCVYCGGTPLCQPNLKATLLAGPLKFRISDLVLKRHDYFRNWPYLPLRVLILPNKTWGEMRIKKYL